MPFTRRDFAAGLRLLLHHTTALVLAVAIPFVTRGVIEISCAHVCLVYFLGLLAANAISHAGKKGADKLVRLSSWCLLAIPALITSAQAPHPVICFLAEYSCLNLALRLPQVSYLVLQDSEDRRYGTSVTAAAAILHAGALLTCLILRECPTANFPAFIAGLLVPGFLYALLCYNNISFEKTQQASNDAASKFAYGAPGIKTLTARELSAVELTAQGLTSKECAEKLGIKPSTVREYLRRAYNKLGISSSQELKDLLGPKETAQQTQQKSVGCSAALRRTSFAIAPLSASLVIAPLGFASEQWGAGSTDILAIATGLIVASSFFTQKGIRHRQATDQTAALFIGSANLLSIILLVSSLLGSGQEAAFSLFRICARFTLTALLALFFLGTSQDPTLPGVVLDKHLLAYFFVLGLAAEEIWRGSYWFSFMPATCFFILTAGIGAIRALRRGCSKRASVCLACLTVGFACCLALSKDPTMALVTFLLFMLVSPFAVFAETRTFDIPGTKAALALSVGLFAGIYGMNGFASIFTYHVGALGTFGTQTGVEALSIAAATVVFLGAGTMLLRDVTTIQKRRITANGDVPLPSEIAQYLEAFNLTKTQIDVAVQLLQGKTVGEVAESLRYSPITVRAARNHVFETFGVKSIDKLSDVICAGIRCSQAD